MEKYSSHVKEVNKIADIWYPNTDLNIRISEIAGDMEATYLVHSKLIGKRTITNFGTNLENTIETVKELYTIFARYLQSLLKSAIRPEYTREEKSARSFIFGHSSEWRKFLTGDRSKSMFNITEKWSDDKKHGVLEYTPRYNPSELEAVVVFVKQTKSGILVLKNPTFEIEKILNKHHESSRPTLEIYTVSKKSNMLTLIPVHFRSNKLHIPESSAEGIVDYSVIEETSNCLIVDVCIARVGPEDTGDYLEKTHKRYTVKTDSKGKNNLATKHIEVPEWMTEAITYRDLHKNPRNTKIHTYINQEPRYVGVHLWVCTEDLVYINQAEDMWMPLDGGLATLEAYRQTLPKYLVDEFDRFQLAEKLMK